MKYKRYLYVLIILLISLVLFFFTQACEKNPNKKNIVSEEKIWSYVQEYIKENYQGFENASFPPFRDEFISKDTDIVYNINAYFYDLDQSCCGPLKKINFSNKIEYKKGKFLLYDIHLD